MSRLLDAKTIDGVTLSKYIRRPEATWDDVVSYVPELRSVDVQVAQQVVYDLKYAGYVARQQSEIDRQARLAAKRIPESFRYEGIVQLRAEAREKLVARAAAEFGTSQPNQRHHAGGRRALDRAS